MTINGAAPMILAMFMNCAIDQQVEKYLKEDPQRWADAETKIAKFFEGREQPKYHGDLPPTNDGLGLGLLGVSGDQVVDADTYRSEEHTSELQSLMRISYAVFCLKKKIHDY